MKQYRIGVGVAGSFASIHYKAGISRYVMDEENIDDETIQFIDINYKFTNLFSVIAKAEIMEDANIYPLSFKMQNSIRASHLNIKVFILILPAED